MSVSAPLNLAERFARCVELFRDPGAKEAQKVEFRVLLGLLQGEQFHLVEDGTKVVVNGVRVDGPALAPLMHRLALHNVGEIVVPRDAVPAELFELVRALADQPGVDDIPSRLRAGGSSHVVVKLAAPTAPPEAPSSGLGTEGILRGEPMRDIASPKGARQLRLLPRLFRSPRGWRQLRPISPRRRRSRRNREMCSTS
jgi:hypothetical protein